MAVTSKRELILDYIRTDILPLINGVGNFNLSLNTVSRMFLTPDEIDGSGYPATCILDTGNTAYSRLTANDYTTGSGQSAADGMPVTIVGYVKVDESTVDFSGLLSKEMNKLYSDIVIAMHSDETMNDHAITTTMTNAVMSLDFLQSNVGTVILEFMVKYDFSPKSNTT